MIFISQLSKGSMLNWGHYKKVVQLTKERITLLEEKIGHLDSELYEKLDE